MSTIRTVAKAAAFLMAANLVSRILGFFRESLVAGLFGKNDLTDAFNTAFILPDLLYWLLVGGVLSSAFIPVVSEYIAKGQREEGWRIISSVVNLIFVALSSLTVLGLILTPQFVQLQVPGFDAHTTALTIHLTRIILIQPLILALSGLTMGILNAHKVFWPSALGSVLYNACIIVFGTLFTYLGLGISGFAFGVVIGAVANFSVQIPSLRRIGMKYHPIIEFRHPGVRRIGALAIPIVLSYTLNQLQVIVNSHLGSSLPAGSLTAVWQSYRLYQLPVGIFALAIAVAVFPTLTEQATLGHWQEFKATSSSALRTIIFITVPISMGMIVLRYPLIRVLFQHGQFTAADTAATAIPLLYFAVGIAAQSVIQILPRMFYALQDTWTPVLLGLVAMGVNILLMILLVKPLAHGGLAFATSIAAVVNMFLLLFVLRRRLGAMDGRRIFATFMKSLAAAAVMGLVVWSWSTELARLLGYGTVVSSVVLVTGTILGALVFATLARWMKMEEFKQVWAVAQRRLKE